MTLFSFIPANEEEGRMMITALLPYLRHLHPHPNINKGFTADAAERASLAHWDAEKQCLVTDADRNLDLLLECDGDLDLPDLPAQQPVQIEGAPRPDPSALATLQTNALMEDDDTVSTLGQRRTPAEIAKLIAQAREKEGPSPPAPATSTDIAAPDQPQQPPPQSVPTTNSPPASTSSVSGTIATSFSTAAQSHASFASFTSRVSTMEARFDQFELNQQGHQQQQNQLFDAFTAKMQKFMENMPPRSPALPPDPPPDSHPAPPADSARPRQAAELPPDSVGGLAASGARL